MSQEKTLKLSDQAIGALMITLQRCLANQEDIVSLLRDWDLKVAEEGVVVLNPPVYSVPEEIE